MKNQKKQTLKMDLPFLKNDIKKNLHTLIFTALLQICNRDSLHVGWRDLKILKPQKAFGIASVFNS
jgi:hypothetical protein